MIQVPHHHISIMKIILFWGTTTLAVVVSASPVEIIEAIVPQESDILDTILFSTRLDETLYSYHGEDYTTFSPLLFGIIVLLVICTSLCSYKIDKNSSRSKMQILTQRIEKLENQFI